ncbi:urease accessory protein UreF [Lentibacillus sp. Marseille-P4043]|uniref:urease accessory protein UreF n=1 Tax=Lentibacillus sp. Marseille-P4043 TaxID=2040293 RepID=UPI000D0B076B|nr:urease accessory UreF family protein [Lentibacillus sp. Marseille-P4043]
MNNEWLFFQLIDSALPTGAFSHSFGLETAYQEGQIKDPDDLYNWAYHYITGVLTPIDGIAISITYQTLKDEITSGQIPEQVKHSMQKLDQKLTMCKMSSESRKGGIKLGKSYLKVINTLYPDSGLLQYSDWINGKLCYGNPAIVHGWISAYLAVSLELAVFTHLYSSINMLLQSALRMTIVGQTDVQLILQRLYPMLTKSAKEISAGSYSENDLCSYSVVQEVEGMRHETLYSRLFMS